MKYRKFSIMISDIIPQQHYLSRVKLEAVSQFLDKGGEYGDIYVIIYKNKVFSVDGNHRLYYLYDKGIREVEVINEIADNDNRIYQMLADEALELGFNSISDLKSRIINNEDEYNKKWRGKCQLLMTQLTDSGNS